MKAILVGAAIAAAAAALLPAQTASAQILVPLDLRVTNVTAAGSGCPSGTPSVVYAPGQNALLVTAPPGLSVATGPGRDPSDSNRSCTFLIGVDVMPGYRFAVTRAVYQGSARLDAGVLGRHSISYWLQGRFDERGTFTTNLSGPYQGGFQRDQAAASVMWSSCDGDQLLAVSLNAAVSNIGNPRGSGTLRGGPGTYRLGLAWAPCSGGSSPDVTLEPWLFPVSPGGPP